MQHPTCTGIRVRSPADAHVIFHAVSLQMLPMIVRRLDTEERRAISSGCVFVWEERGGPHTEPMGLGIERWTDSIRWGPSRVREEFLFYHERDPDPIDIDLGGYDSETASPLEYNPSHALLRENLIKQTYSVFVETALGKRKWHLIAYFTQNSVDYLRTVDDIPALASLQVPPGIYTSARSSRQPARLNRDRGTFPQYLNGLYNNGTVYNARQAHAHPVSVSPTDAIAVQVRAYARIHAPHQGRDQENSTGTGTIAATGMLAPLEFLENIPPPCRHPLDEKALMSFVLVFPG